MALLEECEALTKAFSGVGVDEKSIISILGKWQPEEIKSYRKGCSLFFSEDDRLFERWGGDLIEFLHHEFLRFKNAVVLWTMHPWERDARLLNDALTRGPESYNVLIEIACTRSSEELLGARRAYHSLFDRSIEEDVAFNVEDGRRKLLVGLVSSYRYEGSRVNGETAKSEALILCNAIKNAKKKHPVEDDEVVRILTTRSKPHLRAIFSYYKEICSKPIDKELEDDLSLKETVQCLSSPQTYFSKVLDMALKREADEHVKGALTRVIVTRAGVDLKEIKEEYHKLHGVHLSHKIQDIAHGNYQEFLLTLLARGDQ